MAGTKNGAAKIKRRGDGTFLAERNELAASQPDPYRLLTFGRIGQQAPNQIPAMPPGNGRFPVEAVWTFQGRVSSVSRVYQNPDEAFRDSRQNARFMRNDCSIMECLEARQRAVALLNWHIEPDDSEKKNTQHIEVCQQITRLVKLIPNFKRYRQSLLEAIWFGRYANSHQWAWTFKNGPRQAYISKWLPINGDKLAFRFDEGDGKYEEGDVGIRVHSNANIRNTDQIANTDWGRAYFLKPWERPMLAIHKHIIEDAPFDDPIAAGSIHGLGIRSRIYWTWFQSQEMLAMLVEFAERFGLGVTIYYYQYGNEQSRIQMEGVAREQHPFNHILIPRLVGDPALDAHGFDRIEPNPAGAEMLRVLITDLFGQRMKRYILGQTLTTESDGAGLGSSGISDLHKWSFFQIVKSDAIDLEETLTEQVVNRIVEFGFPYARDWGIKFKIDTEHPNTVQQLEAANIAYQMGTKLKSSDIYDLIGMSAPEEGDEILDVTKQQMGFGGGPGEGGPLTTTDAIRGAIGDRQFGGGNGGNAGGSERMRLSDMIRIRNDLQSGERWVTIGGQEGGDGKKHGGVAVLIRGGRIVRGPASLKGRSLDALTGSKKPKSKFHQAVSKAAKEHRIKSSEIRDAVEYVWGERRQAIEEREHAKARARKLTGLTQADYGRLSNEGKDWSAVPRFDESAQEIAREYPELGLGDPGDKSADLSSGLWSIIGEGKLAPPARHSDEIIGQAVELAKSARAVTVSPEWSRVPFAMAGRVERFAMYHRDAGLLREAVIQDKLNAEFEAQHPRDDDGRFTVKPEIREAAERLLSKNPTIAKGTIRSHAIAKGLDPDELLAAIRQQRATGRPSGDALTGQQEASASAKKKHEIYLQKTAERESRLEAADTIFAEIDVALKSAGAVLENESESGSRYYRLPDGTPLRVADHAPNDPTDQWMERSNAMAIDVGGRGWRMALESILEGIRGA